jgi:hypothetical protein
VAVAALPDALLDQLFRIYLMRRRRVHVDAVAVSPMHLCAERGDEFPSRIFLLPCGKPSASKLLSGLRA